MTRSFGGAPGVSRARWLFPVVAGLALACCSLARANDRLPPRLQKAYERGVRAAKGYAAFILEKVYVPKLAAILVTKIEAPARRGAVARLVDEAVQLLLPHSRRIVQDVIFGTSETHLAITAPERGTLAPLQPGANPPTGDVLRDAIDRASRVQERALEDRLEQALAEDLEDYVQRECEGRVGLRVVGRPRGLARALPKKWRAAYAGIRDEVYRHTYWWLRKRQRLKLTHMARTMTPEEIDRARDREMWGVSSALSYEAWAQNRYRMDFRYGRFNWQVDRRRIRRRMDQDEARAAWGLTRLVRELTSDETQAETRKTLERRVEEELSKAPLRAEAERFPDSGPELQKKLEGLKGEMNPIFDRAMDKVELPPDMSGLAREHGRRYGQEDLDGELTRSIQRGAAPFAAAKGVREKLGDLVGAAGARVDLGEAALEPKARRDAIKKQIDPVIDDEIESTLRRAGLDRELADPKARAEAVRAVRSKHDLEGAIERALDEDEARRAAPADAPRPEPPAP